jgi:phenylacetic acid degradation operon negative regulatory protein
MQRHQLQKSVRIGQGSARSILLTLLGEFVWTSDQPVPNSVLVRGLEITGVAEKAARQAIARAAAAGWMTPQKEGRLVKWSLTPQLRHFIDEGTQRVYAVDRESAPWSGRWLILFISLPDKHRMARQKLYSLLRWAGFGNPSPSLWVSPHSDRLEEARRIIQTLQLADVTFSFVGQSVDLGVTDQRLVQLSWDLDSVSAHYASLQSKFSQIALKTDNDVFLAHIDLVTALQKIPFVDPGLPPALFPLQWNGHRVAAEFAAMVKQWRGAAQRRWKEIAATVPLR